MKPQVVVTSYARPKYLIPCLESLRQDDIELYVVDGGSDFETMKVVGNMADGQIFMSGNPGADVLKNEGIRVFVTQPRFIITSDDLIFPKGYSKLLLDQYAELNSRPEIEKWTMCTCPTEEIARDYQDSFPPANGVPIMEIGISMVSGAVIETEAWSRVGGFPIYGKAGCGDVAISLRLRRLGYRLGYFQEPVVKHLGIAKAADYPQYSAAFRLDEDFWYEEARKDIWMP